MLCDGRRSVRRGWLLRALGECAAAALMAPAGYCAPLKKGDVIFPVEYNSVVRVDPASGVAAVLSAPSVTESIDDIAIEPNGGVVAAASLSIHLPPVAAVVRIDPETGARTILASGGALAKTRSIAIVASPAGRIYLATDDFTTLSIHEVNATTGALAPVASGGLLLSGSSAMAWEPATGSLLVCMPLPAGSGRIVRVNPAGGGASIVSTGAPIVTPYDLGVAPDGSILLAHGVGTILRIDPTTGAKSVFATLAPVAGSALTGLAVALEPTGTVLVKGVTNSGQYALARYLSVGGADPQTVWTSPSLTLNSLAVFDPAPCPSDINGDGQIGFNDLNELLTRYGQSCPTP